MIENLSKTKRNVALSVIAVLVIWFSWTVRTVLNPVLLAYIFASTLHPLVQRMEKRGWKRRTAVNLIFAGFSLLLLSISLGLYSQGRMMVRDVFDKDIDLIGRIERSFDEFVEEHHGLFATLLPEQDTTQPAGEGTTAVEAADAASGADDSSEEPGAFSELLRGAGDALTDEQFGAGRMALKGAGSAWSLLQVWFGSVLSFLTLTLLLPIYTYFLLTRAPTGVRIPRSSWRLLGSQFCSCTCRSQVAV